MDMSDCRHQLISHILIGIIGISYIIMIDLNNTKYFAWCCTFLSASSLVQSSRYTVVVVKMEEIFSPKLCKKK